MDKVRTALQLCGEHDIAKHANLHWVKHSPILKLRAAHWPGNGKGVVHIFHGRAEYIEKYYDPIAKFNAMGFDVVAHDWRGHGFSTRNSEKPLRCHVDDFEEYQDDAKRVIDYFSHLQGPRILFAHSMGGAIGLEYISQNPGHFDRAIFSAPMWDINAPPLLNLIRQPIAKFGLMMGWDYELVPTTFDENYEVITSFQNNNLTHDQNAYEWVVALLKAHKELSCYGPTYGWTHAAFQQIARFNALPQIDTPALVTCGSKEEVVSQKAIRDVCAKQAQFSLLELEGSFHQDYLEVQDIREKLWNYIDMFVSEYLK